MIDSKAFIVLALLGGCVDSATDGETDDFLVDGKADSTLSQRTTDAVLRVANESSLKVLDEDVQLDARTAKAIIAYRNGIDGVPGTRDDRRFFRLEEIDAMPYTGPVAFQHLTSYGLAHDPDPTGPGTLGLRITETNHGSGTISKDATAASPSKTFGAEIRGGVLWIRANVDDVALTVRVGTTPVDRVPDRFDVRSPAMSPTLKLGSTLYSYEGGGLVTIASCPKLGSSVTATLFGVRLLENQIGYSIKEITGKVEVQVVESDGSLFCD